MLRTDEGGASATADGTALLIPAKAPALPHVACKARTHSLPPLPTAANKPSPSPHPSLSRPSAFGAALMAFSSAVPMA